MSLPNFSSIKNLTEDQINETILNLKKELFDLRLRKVTRQSFNPHSFMCTKRKIAHLLTLRMLKKKSI